MSAQPPFLTTIFLAELFHQYVAASSSPHAGVVGVGVLQVSSVAVGFCCFFVVGGQRSQIEGTRGAACSYICFTAEFER